MKITIAGIGKIKEKWMRDGIAEYTTRLTPIARVETIEISEEKMPENPPPAVKEKILETEAEKLLRAAGRADYTVLLDLTGREVSSVDLAELFQKEMLTGKNSFIFLIGGPYGNGDALRRAADFRLKLSPMTFTHQMTRLILIEQIYRAMKIMRHEPYHL